MDGKIEIGKDPATRSQIIEIQVLTILKYCCDHVRYVSQKDAEKIQEMFDIVNRK